MAKLKPLSGIILFIGLSKKNSREKWVGLVELVRSYNYLLAKSVRYATKYGHKPFLNRSYITFIHKIKVTFIQIILDFTSCLVKF